MSAPESIASVELDAPVAGLFELLRQVAQSAHREAACERLREGLMWLFAASGASWFSAPDESRALPVEVLAGNRVMLVHLSPAASRCPLGSLRLSRDRAWSTAEATLIAAAVEPLAAALESLPAGPADSLSSLSRLAGGVAHGCNNLLQSIVGYACLGQARGAGEVVVSGYLREIERSGYAMAELLANLMAYSESGARRPELLVPDRVVREAVPTALVPARVELALGAGETVIRADRLSLRRAVGNLLDNALAAGGTDHLARLETTVVQVNRPLGGGGLEPPTGVYYRLRVADRGPGIPPELRPALFRPFVSTNGPGRGLGMAAVAGICRSHGGGVALRSSSRGTEVEAFFPL